MRGFCRYIIGTAAEIAAIFRRELKGIFSDSGVLLILVIAGILYPVLYNLVYLNEDLPDLEVAVVDMCDSEQSRSFTRSLDATKCVSTLSLPDMEQARTLFERRDVHAILLFPRDYSERLARNEQATLALYVNMSSFLLYKSIALAVSDVMLESMQQLQLETYCAGGSTDEQAMQMVEALPYEESVLFNPGSGFASFFVPVILMIIIHQLLFFGIGMNLGTEREEGGRRGGLCLLFGKSAAFFFIYSIIGSYIALIIPHLFNLPHLAQVWDIYRMLIPYLMATIFFSMSCSIFIRNRESGMVLFLFFSLILVFLTGFIWPLDSFPAFWRYFAYLFPSTFGARAYVKLQAMGAGFHIVEPEYIALWVQTLCYLLISIILFRYSQSKSHFSPQSGQKGE